MKLKRGLTMQSISAKEMNPPEHNTSHSRGWSPLKSSADAWKQSLSWCIPTLGRRGRPGAQVGMWAAGRGLRVCSSHDWCSDLWVPVFSSLLVPKYISRQLGMGVGLAGVVLLKQRSQETPINVYPTVTPALLAPSRPSLKWAS